LIQQAQGIPDASFGLPGNQSQGLFAVGNLFQLHQAG
jgi:hypothetical protein